MAASATEHGSGRGVEHGRGKGTFGQGARRPQERSREACRTDGGPGRRAARAATHGPAGAWGGTGATLRLGDLRFNFVRSDARKPFQGGIHFFGKISVNDLRSSSVFLQDVLTGQGPSNPPRTLTEGQGPCWSLCVERPPQLLPATPHPHPVHRCPRHGRLCVSVTAHGHSRSVRGASVSCSRLSSGSSPCPPHPTVSPTMAPRATWAHGSAPHTPAPAFASRRVSHFPAEATWSASPLPDTCVRGGMP